MDTPLEVLIFEDSVEISDLNNYSYPESERGLEFEKEAIDTGLYDLFNEKAIKEFMKVVEKESRFPINITLRVRYEGLELAKDKDLIITDIGIPGPEYVLSPKADLDKTQEYLVEGFERLYGKDWAKINDGTHIRWNVFQDPETWLYDLSRSLLSENDPDEDWYLNQNIAGLHIAKELGKVTMYTGDLRHQPGIHCGLINGIISPEEFIEIYEKHTRWDEKRKKLTSVEGPVPINDGRIIIGKSSTYKTVQDYVTAIEIAKTYQLG